MDIRYKGLVNLPSSEVMIVTPVLHSNRECVVDIPKPEKLFYILFSIWRVGSGID